MTASIRTRLSKSKILAFPVALAVALVGYLLYSAREANVDLFRYELLIFEISTAVIILWIATRSESLPSRVLATESMRFVGRISYALYLWHPVAFRLAYDGFTDIGMQLVAAFTIAFGFATASYYLVERPFLRWKETFERG